MQPKNVRLEVLELVALFLPHKKHRYFTGTLPWYYHKVWVTCVSPAIEMHGMAIKVANNHQTLMQSQSA